MSRNRAWWQDEDYVASHYEPDETVNTPRSNDIGPDESKHLWNLCDPTTCTFDHPDRKEDADGGTA